MASPLLKNDLDTTLNEIREELRQRHKDQLEVCERTGADQGKRQMPAVAYEELEPFEKGVIAQYGAQIAYLYERAEELLATIHSDISWINKELNETVAAQLREDISNAEAEKNRRLEEEEDKHNNRVKNIHNNPFRLSARKEIERAQTEYDEELKKSGSVKPTIGKPIWYRLLLPAIGIAEVPLNYEVFQSFGEVPLITLLMALSLVIAIPFSAHGTGKFLKQIKEHPLIYPIFSIIAVSLIVVICYFTAQFRADYLATKGLPSTQLGTTTFFLIGVILFCVGVFASHYVHNPSAKVEQLYNAYMAAVENYNQRESEHDRSLDDEDKRHRTEKDKIHNEFTEKRKEAIGRVETLKKVLHTRIGEYNRVLGCLKGLEQVVNQNCKIAIQHYRTANALHREGFVHPLAWKRDLPDLETNLKDRPELEEPAAYRQKSFVASKSS